MKAYGKMTLKRVKVVVLGRTETCTREITKMICRMGKELSNQKTKSTQAKSKMDFFMGKVYSKRLSLHMKANSKKETCMEQVQ